MRPKAFQSLLIPIFATALLSGNASAQSHPSGVPALSSRPGAAYTIYLNVAGFTFDGTFAPESAAPGFTPALNEVAPTGTFSATEQEQIQKLWARAAQSYVGLDVNVTTVDPAVAAGQAATDAQRQAYYDATPRMMHTVIGSGLRDHDNNSSTPMQSWIPGGGADGTSGLNVVSAAGSGGTHTNFMLTEAQAGAATEFTINGDYIGAVASHENGHAFGLSHQSDYTADTLGAEYSVGDAAAGNGSWVPIMGNASDRQRVAWRVGDAEVNDTRTPQNDVARLLTLNAGLTLVEDGIGHTRPTATPLDFVGDEVDYTTAHGVIVPSDSGNPTPSATTEDWFSFTLDEETEITLTSNNSTQFLTPGEADGVGTLRSKLTIFDVDGIELMQGTEAVDTLLTTLTATLPAGTYFPMVTADDPHDQNNPAFNAAQYYNIGAYFLTGEFSPVPEPGSLALVLVSGLLIIRRRR